MKRNPVEELDLGRYLDLPELPAPSSDDMPEKNEPYAEEAEYLPSVVQRQMNLSGTVVCNCFLFLVGIGGGIIVPLKCIVVLIMHVLCMVKLYSSSHHKNFCFLKKVTSNFFIHACLFPCIDHRQETGKNNLYIIYRAL